MRITYDPEADAAYIDLTGAELAPGRENTFADVPDGVGGEVILDWKDGKLVGVEVLGAGELLHSDLLGRATLPGRR